MNMYAVEDTPLTCDASSGDGFWVCCQVAHPEEPTRHFMIHREP